MEVEQSKPEDILLKIVGAPSDAIRELAASMRTSSAEIVSQSLGLYLVIANALRSDPRSRIIIENASGHLTEICGPSLDMLRSQKRH